ncbi:MAG: GMC family oxidoreductase [Congregibacter sp.]
MQVSQDDEAIVVVGSGAGGATLAERLTAAGKRVVLLEAGEHIKASEWHQDDFAAFAQLSWLDPRVASGTYLAAQVAPSMPAWIVKALGGSTLHWNGLAYRAQAHELRARSVYGDVTDSSIADWPLSYDELAPYYDQAESRLGVTGTHGIEPHPPSNNYRVLEAAAQRCGYTQVSNAHIAINSGPRDGRPGCLQMGFCNQGCKVHAKWSTLASDIPRAQASGKLDLRTGCQAIEVEVNKRGRARAIVYRDAQGVLQRQRASWVFLACNSIETARLMLLSKSPAFPDGLGNTYGHVGRHYTRHVVALAFARMPGPVSMHRGIVTPGTIFDEAKHDPQRGFAGGYLMEAVAMAPVALAMMISPGQWGEDFAHFMESYDHLAGVLLNGEEMPRAGNRVTLDSAVKDSLGLPVANVHVDEHRYCDVMRQHFRERATQLYESLDGRDIRFGTPPSATHNLGTARMSHAPGNGVTNAFGRSHEVSNLFVGDGSLFPSSTAENPTLTIVALALRQADYFLQELA